MSESEYQPPPSCNDYVTVPLDIQNYADNRNMNIKQINAQRIYGPPKSTEPGFTPPNGSEVFFARIPRNQFEPDLVPFLERAGRIFEFRLMMDFSGTNRGYGFIRYHTPKQAARAVATLNGAEILPRHRVIIVRSVDNRKLFLGGVPIDVTRDDIHNELESFSGGVVRVWKRWWNRTGSPRGAVVVLYDSHRTAAVARSKMLSTKFRLWGNKISVDWAEPELETKFTRVQSDQVLRVANLSRTIRTSVIWEAFRHGSHHGVKSIKRYPTTAFVSFYTRRHAEDAKAALNGSVIQGKEIQVDWQRPQIKDPRPQHKRDNWRKKSLEKSPTPPTFKAKLDAGSKEALRTLETTTNTLDSNLSTRKRNRKGRRSQRNEKEFIGPPQEPCNYNACAWSYEEAPINPYYIPCVPWDSEWVQGMVPTDCQLMPPVYYHPVYEFFEPPPPPESTVYYYGSDGSSYHTATVELVVGQAPPQAGGCDCVICWPRKEDVPEPSCSVH